eukprot:3593179-Rhodomonas_salina.1
MPAARVKDSWVRLYATGTAILYAAICLPYAAISLLYAAISLLYTAICILDAAICLLCDSRYCDSVCRYLPTRLLGIVIPYAAICLLYDARYRHSTAMRCPVLRSRMPLSAFVPATQCPVLRQLSVLSAYYTTPSTKLAYHATCPFSRPPPPPY